MLSWFNKRKEAQLIQKLKLTRLMKGMDDSLASHQQEINIYLQLAHLYGKCIGLKAYPYAHEMQKLAYRKAARLGNDDAKLWLCREMLKHAAEKEAWLSEGIFENDLHQKDYHAMYAQAQKMLSRLSETHLEARILLGVARLHGSGEPVNLSEAYAYLVDLVDQEDAWHDLTQLFSNVHIQRPNFFDELIRFRTEGMI